MLNKIIAPVIMASMVSTSISALEHDTGTIETNILFHYNDSYEQVSSRNIILSLYRNETLLGNIVLNYPVETLAGYPVMVSPILGEDGKILSYQVVVSGLEQGEYRIGLTGKYHKDFLSEEITLDDTSKQLTLSTQGQDFTYGDVNGDNLVDSYDLDALQRHISSNMHSYDLTGDEKVDITDLALVKMNLSATGSAVILDTEFLNIASLFDLEQMETQWSEGATVEGSLDDLFKNGNQEAVILSAVDGEEISEENPVTFPLILENPTELAQIELISTTEMGGITQGFVEVEYIKDGVYVTENIPFSSDFAQSLEKSGEDDNVIVIRLGERVVVKTIQVTVELVEGDQYALLKEVNFVRDLVPEDPQASNGLVDHFVAISGDESVTLSWSGVNNVSGYRVYYGTSRGNYISTLNTTALSAKITGLDNFMTYYFAVTSTHDDWTSGFSQEVSVTPAPTSVPGITTFLEANPMDKGASLRWQSNSKASSYHIYGKKEGDTEYFLADTTTSTSILLGGLENGEEYSFYITGVNDIGEGKGSNILTVTPEKENLDGPTLPTSGRIPNSAVIQVEMQDSTNVKSELYPNGFDLDFILDEDFATDWVADQWYKSSAITFTFEDTYDMSHLIYVGKMEGDYRSSLSHATVEIWTEEDDLEQAASLTYTDSSIRYTNTLGEEFAVINFPRSDVKQIRVMVAQWNGSPTNVSLSEILFYEHNTIDDDIAELFANDTFTKLNSWVTETHIDNLRARVEELEEYVTNRDILFRELDMADDLLLGYELKGLTIDHFVSIDNSEDDPSLSDISPLGVLGYAGNQMTIYADIPEGETIEILPSQYYSEAFQHLGTGIVLENGRNIITVEQLTSINVTKGGAMYYRYSGHKGDEITLYFDTRYNSQGVLDLVTMPVLSLYNFYDLTESQVKDKIEIYLEELEIFATQTMNSPSLNPTNSTEISLRNVLLSLPATEVYNGLSGYDTLEEQVEGLYQNILAWEELLMVCNVAYGLDNWENPREARQNIRYMRMSDTAFMYAGGNHIGIQYGSVAALMKGQPTSLTGEGNQNSLFGWGIAHEIGHNLDRLGRPEITNNIYSLLAQTFDGGYSYNSSRLTGMYDDIYSKVTSGNLGIANNVFVQLGMYWQLQQAYCGENPLEFYNLVNKTYKYGENSSYSGDERFAVAVSHVVERDLSSFFTAWGVELSEEALEEMGEYQEETRKIQYFNDESREYRLTGGTGSSSVSGIVETNYNSNNVKEISMRFYPFYVTSGVLGYEWYRNDTLIGFTTEPYFTDILGSVNNTALEYSVQVVDKLGNTVSSGIKAEGFRVEYDNVVESDLYTYVQDGDAWKFMFYDSTVLSGLIFTEEKEDTEFTVEILSESKEKIFAKSDKVSYSDEKSLHYFNKPNVESTDTRIGVYDVSTLWISGINSPEDVSFLGYIGDNVSFMQQPVGVLAEDFDTGAGVLEEGTVIVVGEYLGDPYFNEITLWGKFAHSHGIEEEIHYEERAFSGTTYLIGYDTETVSTISDGLFLFVPDVQTEEALQDMDHTTCTTFSVFPAELKAIMERTSDTGNYQTSDTVWISVPTEDSMPLIYLE